MSIILFDIETSFIEVKYNTFSLYDNNPTISHKNIVKDWFIICACWKELGKKTVRSSSVTDNPKSFKKDPHDDLLVVKALKKMLSGASILIGHNLNKFDVKKFNARLLYHDLEPLPPIRTIDTLKEARAIAQFTSNRLDYLGKHLGVGNKIETRPHLWEDAQEGDASAIKSMVRYCKGDVELLERVYLKLRPHMKNHPNISDVGSLSCPRCGSHNFKKHQNKVSSSGIVRRQYQCKDCFGFFSERLSLKEKPLSA